MTEGPRLSRPAVEQKHVRHVEPTPPLQPPTVALPALAAPAPALAHLRHAGSLAVCTGRQSPIGS
jgi:hypothetical protein